MTINLIEADQLVNFIYWNEKTHKYETMLCSVIEYLHCFCDVSTLDIYKLERKYDYRRSPNMDRQASSADLKG